MTLEEFFRENPECALAFSGGTDSAFLLYAAKKYARRVRAYYVSSAFQPRFELDDARRLASELCAEMSVLKVDVLATEEVRTNPPDRCYHCKRAIFSAISAAARADGFTVLLDGTNASDNAGDRPGMRALRGTLPPARVRPDEAGSTPPVPQSGTFHLGQARIRLLSHARPLRRGAYHREAATNRGGRIRASRARI